MNAGLGRSWRLLRAFRREQTEPEVAYEMLAADTVEIIRRHTCRTDLRVVDVGGGPGYVERAMRDAGFECFTVDASAPEFALHGAGPERPVVADGRFLPFRDRAFDLAHSSNVLEHVSDPWSMLDEMVRVLRPGGLGFVFFTNWLSPHGGHETAPWHYLGGARASRRFERRQGRRPKNQFGESLFRIGVGEVLRWTRQHADVELVDAFPRYYPRWTRGIVRVPGVREVLTWNLAVVVRRRW